IHTIKIPITTTTSALVHLVTIIPCGHNVDYHPLSLTEMNLMEKIEREKLDLIKDLIQKKMKLSKHITNLENDIRICNMRGALEFIRSMIQSQDKTILFREPTDNILMRLTQDAKFISYLKQTCLLNNSQYKDVERCIGGLYHTASKKLHGHDKDIEIDTRELAEYFYKLAEYP
ncbi:11442_t:CDS:2, partial [Dentiscutata heterogama]